LTSIYDGVVNAMMVFFFTFFQSHERVDDERQEKYSHDRQNKHDRVFESDEFPFKRVR
jgi:hypothetical protein